MLITTFHIIQSLSIGGYIQKRCLFLVTCVPTILFTTQIPILKTMKIQLIKNSIFQEKKSSIRILQYDDSWTHSGGKYNPALTDVPKCQLIPHVFTIACYSRYYLVLPKITYLQQDVNSFKHGKNRFLHDFNTHLYCIMENKQKGIKCFTFTTPVKRIIYFTYILLSNAKYKT